MKKNNFTAIFISYILLIIAFVIYFTFHNVWLEGFCIVTGFLILLSLILSKKNKYKLKKTKKTLDKKEIKNIKKKSSEKDNEKIGAEEIAELWEEMDK